MTQTKWSEIRAFFARSLENYDFGQPGDLTSTVVVAASVPVIAAKAALSILTRVSGATQHPLAQQDAFFWHPPHGMAAVGVGVGAEVRLSGTDRLSDLEKQSEKLFRTCKVISPLGSKIPPLRIFGGLSFSTGDQGKRWKGFDEGWFILPRWCYLRSEERAILSLAISTPEAIPAALTDLDQLCEGFGDGSLSPTEDVEIFEFDEEIKLELEQLNPTIWNRYIKEIRAAISSGDFEKIVAARSTKIQSDQPFDPFLTLERLSHLYPDCHQILFQRQGATFLGAPPETLFDKRGLDLQTHALAGSVRVHPDLTPEEAGLALLRSRKNRQEHAVVVREILSLLENLVESIDCGEEPQVLRLRNLLHLETPISANLRPHVSAATLLNALHPTPAVAGWPRPAAVRWITEHEEPRGWYAGPVGWLDASGNGVFAVAIRSALLRGRCAHVFAGAGIMHDSDPPMEYGETTVKQQAMLSALGVDPSR